jgi:hypothetical protein
MVHPDFKFTQEDDVNLFNGQVVECGHFLGKEILVHGLQHERPKLNLPNL